MNLLKRYMGRAAGVGVGVALLVLGLEAPAFAVIPTISAFTPTSGPAATATGGCVVQITGSAFTNPTVTSVKFNGTPTTDFVIQSDTEIWAVVPTGATSGPISVQNASGTASLDGFVVAPTGGGCTPTIDSISPTCGPVGTQVTITGTNLLRSVSPAILGGHVRFAPYATDAPQVSASPTEIVVTVSADATDAQPIRVDTFNTTVGEGRVFSADQFVVGTCITDFNPKEGNEGTTVTLTGVGFTGTTSVTFNGTEATFTIVSDTEITTTVPIGATSGPIQVVSPGGTATTSSSFTVGTTPPPTHDRAITLKLAKHLVAKGKVTLTVDTSITACVDSVPVKIQRQRHHHWKTIAKTTTGSTGKYHKRIPNKHGKYRSKAPAITVNSGADKCAGATSKVRKN